MAIHSREKSDAMRNCVCNAMAMLNFDHILGWFSYFAMTHHVSSPGTKKKIVIFLFSLLLTANVTT